MGGLIRNKDRCLESIRQSIIPSENVNWLEHNYNDGNVDKQDRRQDDG